MLRVALSGCGAVSRLYYAPALKLLEHEGLISLTGVFDPDCESAKALAAVGKAAVTYADFDALIGDAPDLVIVASPPRFHADQAVAALRAGVAVHCEKPLALSGPEGRRILEAAEASGRLLTVGLMRRAFPAVRAVGELLDRQTIGSLQSIEIFEGGPFSWPVRSPRYFTREESGGGVLRDLGPHVLDLLVQWFGEPELVAYSDDADGGVEANCLLELRWGDTPCSIRLSRDWERPHHHVFTGTQGGISWVPYEPCELRIRAGEEPERCVKVAAFEIPAIPGGPSGDFEHAFATALREAVEQQKAGTTDVTGRSTSLDVLELIDRCYERRRPMDESWRAGDASTEGRHAS